jgi:FG-GAP-like repeat
MLNGRSLSLLSSALVLALAIAASGCQQPTQPRTAPQAAPATASAPASAPAAPPAAPPAARHAPPAEEPGRPPAPDPAGGARSAPPVSAGSGIAPTPTVEPPDGKWLKDKDGREYFIYALPRVENNYEWVEKGKRVRVEYGLVLDVDHYDDKNFYIRYYRPDPAAAAPPPPRGKLTDEERQRIAATYKSDVRTVDRLRFVPFGNGLPERGQWREAFKVADINHDGHLDIVHGPIRKGGSTVPNIYLGDGKGSWTRWPLTIPRLPFDYGDVAVGDLNGDGIADLVIASHLRGITALVGDGKGGFTEWSQGIEFHLPGEKGTASPAFSSRAIAIVDWNGDGRPDIVAAGEGPVLSTTRGPGGAGGKPEPQSDSRGAIVYLNQGDGTWKHRVASGPFTDSLAVADLNGDGRPDFITGSSQLGVRTLLNLGQPDGSWKTVEIPELRPRSLYFSVAVADLNRDGRPDLALAYMANEGGTWRTGIDVLLNGPGMKWERRTVAAVEGTVGIWALAAGDLDGDGNQDLVAFDGEGKGWVFLGDGKGSFERQESPDLVPAEGQCRGYHVVLADLDGDGKDEVVAAFAGESESLPVAGILTPVTCRSGGSLRAWKAVPKGGS